MEDAAAPSSSPSPSPAASPPPAAAHLDLPDVKTDWCLEGWRGLDESTCYFVPESKSPPSELLIYLSGIVPPTPTSPQKEKVQHIVRAVAQRANVVAMLPRGRRGIGPTDAKDWWAWPTSPADVQTYAREIIAEWRAARAKLDGKDSTTAATAAPFAKVYLAGSSSGAYFLTALALSGMIEGDFDGYAATSGGAPRLIAAASTVKKQQPFYVGYAEGDPTNGGPKSLGAFLSSNGWKVKVVAHPGGHGAREEYLDEAIAFWRASK